MLLFTQTVEVRGYPLSELTASDQHYLRSTLTCGKMPPAVTCSEHVKIRCQARTQGGMHHPHQT